MRAAFSGLLFGVLPALMSCGAAGVASVPPPVECQASPEAVVRPLGLERLSLHIPHAMAREQSRDFGGTVCLSTALRLGMVSLLGDTGGSESPRAVVGAGCLVCEMNHPSTRLRLVGRGGPRAERGEDVRLSWVFQLSMPQVSDHVYWAVVARSPNERGEVRVYSYGFN